MKRSTIFKAVCALYLGAYVFMRGDSLLGRGREIGAGHFQFSHLESLTIIPMAVACLIAGDDLPKKVKVLLTILTPFAAIALMFLYQS